MYINKTMTASILFLIGLAIVVPLTSCYKHFPNKYENFGKRNESHNLIIGHYRWGDRLLYHNIINIHRSLFQTKSYYLKYPLHGYNNATINYVRVIDLKTDGTGGYPKLYQGGVGYRNITVHFTSQRSHGLHFNVTIYGK
ncbi:putative salivary secreted peptide [Lycorma delicatula]|uniref:putative salivary secreted peptide n=1 Tax=Lycorma delicatula TaxID=130591 RepID=UPI003F50FFF4